MVALAYSAGYRGTTLQLGPDESARAMYDSDTAGGVRACTRCSMRRRGCRGCSEPSIKAIDGLPEKIRTVIDGLQALRGIKNDSAATIVAEVGPLSHFARPKLLMGYSGMVSSEGCTGDGVRRGAITKTDNAHPRRILGEAAWAYKHRPAMSPQMKKRQERLSEEVREIAWQAQGRLCTRYRRLLAKGELRQKVTTAIGREPLGFIWAIGIQVYSGAAPHGSRP